MTEPLDPEIKAIRAVKRAVWGVDPDARLRIARWLASRVEAEINRPAEQEGAPDD